MAIRRRDRLRLAGETGIGPRTIERWIDDEEGVSTGSAYALAAACRTLGLANPHQSPPPPAQEQEQE